MIRFKDKVFENYFIDPVTSVITDKEGNILHQYKVRGYYCVGFTGSTKKVHQIQAHTAYGYIEGFHVHHIDENKENNSLSNLDYIPPHIHTEVTWKGRHHSETTKQKMSEHNYNKGKHLAKETCEKMSTFQTGLHFWNNGMNEKRSVECPGEGWIRGRLKK